MHLIFNRRLVCTSTLIKSSKEKFRLNAHVEKCHFVNAVARKRFAQQLADTASTARDPRKASSSPSLAHDELGNDVKVIAKRRREFEWAFSISA